MKNLYYLQPFTIDLATNQIYESIAEHKIKIFQLQQGKRIDRILPNPATETSERAKFDLIDTLGTRYEVKTDRIWGTTGFVYIELLALSHTEADYYVIQAFGSAYFVPTEALRADIEGRETVRGGDWMKSEGARLTEPELRKLSVAII